MITRLRSPDGSNRDVDHGPGPVGSRPKFIGRDLIHATPIADAAGPRLAGTWRMLYRSPESYARRQEIQRRYRERQRARKA